MMSPCSSNSTASSLGFAAFKRKRDKINIFSGPFDTNDGRKKLPPAAFLTPAEFYKTLLASAVLQQQQQQQQQQQWQQPHKQIHYAENEECTRALTSPFRCKFFPTHTNAGDIQKATKAVSCVLILNN